MMMADHAPADAAEKFSVASTISDQIHRVPLALIDSDNRLRPADPAWVQVQKDSILSYRANTQEDGIPAPITIRPKEDGRFDLVSGKHRLEACREIGDIDIDALIRVMTPAQARLMEIDENLNRNELSALNRAVFIAERDRIWKELHPDTAKGKAGAKARWHHATENFSFASDTAARVNLSEKSVRNDVNLFRALAITPEVIQAIRGTWLEDHQGQLKALSKVGPEKRMRVLERMLREEKPAANVAAALGEIDGRRVTAADPDETAFAALVTKWTHAPAKARSRFLDHLHSTGALDAYINGPDEEAA